MTQLGQIADAYFEVLLDAFLQATHTDGKIEHKILVGGQKVVMQFAGSGLERMLMPALQHLLIEFAEDPELNVLLWDSTSTRIALPDLPWKITSDEMWRYQTENILAIFLPGLKNILWLDRQKKAAIFWTGDASDVQIDDRGSPLLLLWAGWLADHNIQLTHAAALNGKNGAALLLGKGGSGKSSTALSCLNSPLQYISDDYCLVSIHPDPKVFSIYSSGKVNVKDSHLYPWLQPSFAGLDYEKVLFHLYPKFADRITSQSPLRALLACRITGKDNTTIEEISPAQVMRSIAPSTLLQLHPMIDPHNALQLMAKTVSQVPGYQLSLGTKREQIPEILMKLLGD